MIRSHRGAADIHESHPERKAVLDPRVNLPDGQPDGGSDAERNGGRRSIARLHAARRRQDRHLARRLVRRIHFQADLRGLGGLRRQQRLELEGAKSALPIWTEFMKRAHQHREYRNVTGWDAPDGIVSVDIDPAIRAVGDRRLSQRARGGVRIGNATGGALPVARRRWDSRRWMGDHAGGAAPSAAQPQVATVRQA